MNSKVVFLFALLAVAAMADPIPTEAKADQEGQDQFLLPYAGYAGYAGLGYGYGLGYPYGAAAAVVKTGVPVSTVKTVSSPLVYSGYPYAGYPYAGYRYLY